MRGLSLRRTPGARMSKILRRWRFLRRGRIRSRALKRDLSRSRDLAPGKAGLRHLYPVPCASPLKRFGAVADGGYLLPDDLDGVVAAFSPGVGPEIGFDAEMAALGLSCFLADGSLARPPAGLTPAMTFEPLFLSAQSGDGVISLDDWVARHQPGHEDLLLQIDIEGAEWEVLAAASPETLSRFRIVAIEYHGLSALFRADGAEVNLPVLQKMAEIFDVVHVHPNNNDPPLKVAGTRFGDILEVTYLRKDRNRAPRFAPQIPHPADRANVGHRPNWTLTGWG